MVAGFPIFHFFPIVLNLLAYPFPAEQARDAPTRTALFFDSVSDLLSLPFVFEFRFWWSEVAGSRFFFLCCSIDLWSFSPFCGRLGGADVFAWWVPQGD